MLRGTDTAHGEGLLSHVTDMKLSDHAIEGRLLYCGTAAQPPASQRSRCNAADKQTNPTDITIAGGI